MCTVLDRGGTVGVPTRSDFQNSKILPKTLENKTISFQVGLISVSSTGGMRRMGRLARIRYREKALFRASARTGEKVGPLPWPLRRLTQRSVPGPRRRQQSCLAVAEAPCLLRATNPTRRGRANCPTPRLLICLYFCLFVSVCGPRPAPARTGPPCGGWCGRA